MSYGATAGYGRGEGFGGGAKILYFSPVQALGMGVAIYQYENVGVAPASMDETDDGTIYQYENVGVAPATMDETDDGTIYQYENVGVGAPTMDETDDAIQYQYENVEARPAGSSEENTPTFN